ncbi:glutathione transferase [Comamonas humi]
MQLYVDAQYVSPYAMSVFVALTEKAVPFRMESVNLEKGENQHPAYAGVSLTQRVPTLVHDGFALSESSAITEYLDETFGGTALYPSEPRARARARQVQAWLRSDLLPIRQERSTEVVFYSRKGQLLTAQARAAAAKLFEAADALLDSGSENLFGAWCIADVDLALMLNRLAMHGDPVPKHLAAYARHQWARPSVQLWVNRDRPPLAAH